LVIAHSVWQTFIWMFSVIFSNILSLFLSRILVPTSERSIPYINSPLSLSSPSLTTCWLELSVLLFNISFSILRSTKEKDGPARLRSDVSVLGSLIGGRHSWSRVSTWMFLKSFSSKWPSANSGDDYSSMHPTWT